MVSCDSVLAAASREREMPEQMLLDRHTAAEILSISVRTLDKLIAANKLPVCRIGRRVLLSKEDLEDFARDQKA